MKQDQKWLFTGQADIDQSSVLLTARGNNLPVEPAPKASDHVMTQHFAVPNRLAPCYESSQEQTLLRAIRTSNRTIFHRNLLAPDLIRDSFRSRRIIMANKHHIRATFSLAASRKKPDLQAFCLACRQNSPICHHRWCRTADPSGSRCLSAMMNTVYRQNPDSQTLLASRLDNRIFCLKRNYFLLARSNTRREIRQFHAKTKTNLMKFMSNSNQKVDLIKKNGRVADQAF